MLKALRHRDFRWYWFSSTAWAAGFGMQFLILGWLVLQLTENSSSKLGLMIFIYGLPNLTFILFGGIIADRFERRKVLLTTQLLVTLLVLTVATLVFADLEKMWHIYIIVLLMGTLQALAMPARQAIVAQLVPREDMLNAVALNQAMMNVGRIIGPPVAGGIIDLAGVGPALYLNAACYLSAVLCVLMISGRSQNRAAAGGSTILRDLTTGLNYFWKTPLVFTIVGIGFAMGFFAMPHLHVMPAFAQKVLDAGAGGTGLLLMAIAIGSLFSSIVLASLGDFQRKNWLLLGALLGLGSTLLLFAWSPWYWASWVILLFVGMAASSYIALGSAILNLTVPQEVLGRVLSLWSVGATLIQVGALPMGLVADVASWPIAMSGGATGLLVVVLWLGVWRPTLRQLKV